VFVSGGAVPVPGVGVDELVMGNRGDAVEVSGPGQPGPGQLGEVVPCVGVGDGSGGVVSPGAVLLLSVLLGGGVVVSSVGRELDVEFRHCVHVAVGADHASVPEIDPPPWGKEVALELPDPATASILVVAPPGGAVVDVFVAP
jgi:hypothetical protein